ncbi:uncharacterized protein LOC103518114, partial [Diaphorina citri]|uniref:Uncharacterized protein LOC103518114 n=1 Tax=Diaphorina citri TaxID=121845 RepID=A0A1S4ELZ3_DIACI
FQNEQGSRSITSCVASERHFKKTTDAVETIESYIQSISQEILSANRQLTEVILLLGSSPVNPQDVFQIILPCLSLGHSDAHHSTRKPLHSLMKNILISEILNKVLSRTSSSTNMYVLLKISSSSYDNDDYILREHFHIPANCQHVSFTFHTPVLSTEQCSCVIPYEDSIISFAENSSVENTSGNNSHGNTNSSNEENHKDRKDASSDAVEVNTSNHVEDNHVWYQNKATLKSFRDIQVKGSSVVNFWVNPASFV